MGKILCIDDEPEMVRFIHRALENDGHCVVTSTDGAEGLSRALTDQPDQKVLVLSAAADVQTRVACLERGAVDFMPKPFAVRELLARVSTRLRGVPVSGPASSPASSPESVSSLRTRTMRSTASGVRAVGEVLGRRERGSRAVSPSAS